MPILILMLTMSLLTGCQLIENRADDDQANETEKQGANSHVNSTEQRSLSSLATTVILLKAQGNDSTGAKEAIAQQLRLSAVPSSERFIKLCCRTNR